MKPFVKWAGGKRQILNRINEFINDSIDKNQDFTYIEPFVGGGAVFFDRKPKKAIINDLNEDLINAYRVIQSEKHKELIALLTNYSELYKADPDDFYYLTRALDRQSDWLTSTNSVTRAARMIFLNKTCYNGLYRVNNKGQFNTPIGRYKNPLICDSTNIQEIHDYLSSKDNMIEIMNGSYEHAINKAKDGDVIYIDPPYDYEDDDGFTKYQLAGFTFEDFKALKVCCDKALDTGAFVIISNNATPKVIELFKEDPKYKIFYDVSKFTTLRTINCNGAERKNGKEAIFWGMNNNVPFPQANDINKVIQLVMADEEVLKDKNAAMNLLQVSSVRQVAYYLSALQFLKYFTHDKEFTRQANMVRHSKELLELDIYKNLRQDKLFGKVYKYFIAEKQVDGEIVYQLMFDQEKDKLSTSTLQRRASTLRSWVDWMYKFETENKHLLHR